MVLKLCTSNNGTFYAYNYHEEILTLKAPITTAAEDIHKYFFIVSQRKKDLMFQVNPLLGRGFI